MISFLRNAVIALFVMIPAMLPASYMDVEVAPKFEVARVEGNTVFDSEGRWLSFASGRPGVGERVIIKGITENVAKYGNRGFYLRYNVILSTGHNTHADGQIHGSQAQLGMKYLFKAARVVTDVKVAAPVHYVWNGATHVARVDSIFITVYLDDGSSCNIRSNVHAWVDSNNPPAFPIHVDDIAYVLSDKIVVMDSVGVTREFPLYK